MEFFHQTLCIKSTTLVIHWQAGGTTNCSNGFVVGFYEGLQPVCGSSGRRGQVAWVGYAVPNRAGGFFD